MGFILDGLESEDYDRQYGDRVLLERIISYFRPYTKQMVLVAVMITLSSLAGTGLLSTKQASVMGSKARLMGQAWFRSPEAQAFQNRTMAPGSRLLTTLMAPRPPRPKMLKFRPSSPE